jgi:hypothetical protein
MPASDDQFREAFENLIGTDQEQSIYPGADHSTYGYEEWAVLFEETGIDFDSSADTIDAFENFLLAFYPQENTSGDDWWYVRQEFYDMYGIDDHSIDWEAYREAIGY